MYLKGKRKSYWKRLSKQKNLKPLSVFNSFGLIFLVLISGFFFLILFSKLKPVNKIISPLSRFFSPVSYQNRLSLDSAQTQIQHLAQATPGVWGLYFLNLQTQESFGFNQNQQFTAASTAKVPMVLALYQQAEQGRLDLDQEIALAAADLQEYGTGSLQYQTPPIKTTWRQLAKLALNISDNTASFVIGKYLQYPKMQSFAVDQGMLNTFMPDNLTTPKDMALLFQKFYQGEILNAENTKEVLSYMTNTETEDRIPAGLAPDFLNPLIYHKTGTQTKALSDVALIKTDRSLYVLAIFTKDVPEDLSQPLFSQISNIIYQTQK